MGKEYEMETEKLIKPPVEIRYAGELEALRAVDTGKRPRNWLMQFYSVGLLVCCYTNTMPFLSQLLCSTALGQAC